MASAMKPTIRAFVHEYVWGEFAGNATECVVRAGLRGGTRKSQREYGSQLLRKADVRALVDAQLAEKEALLKQKAVRVAEETYLLATVDHKELLDKDGGLLPLEKIPEHARRALSSVELEFIEKVIHADDGDRVMRQLVVAKYRVHDKRAAQELFLKYAGKLKDKVELEGKDGAPISIVVNGIVRDPG